MKLEDINKLSEIMNMLNEVNFIIDVHHKIISAILKKNDEQLYKDYMESYDYVKENFGTLMVKIMNEIKRDDRND